MPRPKRRASPVKRQAARLLIVEARYYEDIADRLLAGAAPRHGLASGNHTAAAMGLGASELAPRFFAR